MYNKVSSREDQLISKFNVTKGWPLYLVVVPGAIGIYDDFILLLNDTSGIDNMHYSTKSTVSACLDDAAGYYKYHFPNLTQGFINIQRKNELINVGKLKGVS